MTTMTSQPPRATSSAKPPEPAATAKNEARIAVPFQPSNAFPFGLVKFHPDKRQGRALRLVQDALQQKGARLDDGHWVDGPHDTVRWILEQIAKGIPGEVLAAG